MSLVVSLVMVSALLHLGWNLAIRHQAGRLKFVWVLTLSGGVAVALTTLVLRIPLDLIRVWPFLLGTIAAHGCTFGDWHRPIPRGI